MPPLRILALALLLVAPVAGAWQAAPPRAPDAAQAPAAASPPAGRDALPPRRREPRSEQDEEMVQAAREVLVLVDGGRAGEVWDGASPAVQRIVPRAEFLMQVAADRTRLGAVVSRGDPDVGRERYAAGGRVPQGEYVNVVFPTRFANVEAPVRELVSFRLDEDRVWRVSGYSVR